MLPVEPLETPFPSRTVGGHEAEVQCQVCSSRVGWQASRKEGSGTLGTFLGSADWHFSLTYLLLQPWTLNRPSLLPSPSRGPYAGHTQRQREGCWVGIPPTEQEELPRKNPMLVLRWPRCAHLWGCQCL